MDKFLHLVLALPLFLIGCAAVDSVQVFDDKQAAILVQNTFLKNSQPR